MRTRLLHGQGTDKKVIVRLSDACIPSAAFGLLGVLN